VASTLPPSNAATTWPVRGTGAVALGALPFVRDAPGSLVVPRVVIGRRDGEARFTTIAGPGDGPSADRLAGRMAAGVTRGWGHHLGTR
jgi:hypothetical protein